jgi:hypothetical protein
VFDAGDAVEQVAGDQVVTYEYLVRKTLFLFFAAA